VGRPAISSRRSQYRLPKWPVAREESVRGVIMIGASVAALAIAAVQFVYAKRHGGRYSATFGTGILALLLLSSLAKSAPVDLDAWAQVILALAIGCFAGFAYSEVRSAAANRDDRC